ILQAIIVKRLGLTGCRRVIVGKNLVHEIYCKRRLAYDRIRTCLRRNILFRRYWPIAFLPDIDSTQSTTHLNGKDLSICRKHELCRARPLKYTRRQQYQYRHDANNHAHNEWTQPWKMACERMLLKLINYFRRTYYR